MDNTQDLAIPAWADVPFGCKKIGTPPIHQPCHEHHRRYFFTRGTLVRTQFQFGQIETFFFKLNSISDISLLSQPFNGCPWKCHILNPCLFVTICLYFSIFVCLSVFLDPRLFIPLCNTISGHSMCSSIRRILGILAGAQCNTWTVDRLGFSLQWFYNLLILTSCFMLKFCRTSLFQISMSTIKGCHINMVNDNWKWMLWRKGLKTGTLVFLALSSKHVSQYNQFTWFVPYVDVYQA